MLTFLYFCFVVFSPALIPTLWTHKSTYSFSLGTIWEYITYSWSFPGGSAVKNLPANVGDMGLIPGLGRSPGEGNGNPLQYSYLENSMDRGAWRATDHGVAKSWIRPYNNNNLYLRIIKAVYCHRAYLTDMQSTSWEMLGWMKHKLESRLPVEISITSDMQITPLLWQKAKKN